MHGKSPEPISSAINRLGLNGRLLKKARDECAFLLLKSRQGSFLEFTQVSPWHSALRSRDRVNTVSGWKAWEAGNRLDKQDGGEMALLSSARTPPVLVYKTMATHKGDVTPS